MAKCREVYGDYTVLINIESNHATPKMIRRARHYRGVVVDFLLSKSNVYADKSMFDRHKVTALKDMRILLDDPDSEEEERSFARKLLIDLDGANSPSDETEIIEHIHTLMLTNSERQLERTTICKKPLLIGTPSALLMKTWSDSDQSPNQKVHTLASLNATRA